MIELGQPLQCLFCPQRKKIAMMFKIVLAASTAIIVGLLLFPPGSGSEQGRPPVPLPTNQGLTSPHDPRAFDESPLANNLEGSNSKIDQQSEQQIRLKAEDAYQEVQAQLRSILESEPIHFAEARKLLQARRGEILLAKITLLGKESFGGKLPPAPENRLTRLLLDKELKLVSEQLDLLSKANSKE